MILANNTPGFGAPLHPHDAEIFGDSAPRLVADFLAACNATAPTPVYELSSIARQTGVSSVHIKDESSRLSLGSFKALGGSYAVLTLLLEKARRCLGRDLDFNQLSDADVREVARRTTFACATDGNHGRAVAAGARRVGASSVVFVHEGVSAARAEAIAAFGAEIVRVKGTYDDAVDEAARQCSSADWSLVSDTAQPGHERVPGIVMQGYSTIVDEALAQLAVPPTHLFVQAGVGGLAAALAGRFVATLGARRPRIIIVEPARSACLLESAKANAPIRIAAGEPTIMAMLECYEPSFSAWRILSRTADAFMTVEEEDAKAIMRRLARPPAGETLIVSGESGGVGLAGLLRAATDEAGRAALGLNQESRILTINTEGATDLALYQMLVG